jgi:hypothetical protein
VKAKTAELTGPALDHAVAIAIGWQLKRGVWFEVGPEVAGMRVNTQMAKAKEWQPSTDWRDGGWLIERFNLTIWRGILFSSEGDYSARIHAKGPAAESVEGKGPTYLVAAMRTIVARLLGAEVDLPDDFARKAA